MPEKSNSQKLYDAAKASLDQKLVPDDLMELGCVYALNVIYTRAFGRVLCKSDSTFDLKNFLTESSEFKQVDAPEKGVIILSPTGTGNGTLSNGHVGICGNQGIMSNTSATGIWKLNYSYFHWDAWFGKKGGFPILYFKRV